MSNLSQPTPWSSDVRRPLPRLEEPDRDACVGLLYRLLTDEDRHGNVRGKDLGKQELKHCLLLADYARRSAELAPGVKARFDAYAVESFAAAYRERAWTGLGDGTQATEECDVAILTILREELEATVFAFDGDKTVRGTRGNLFIERKLNVQTGHKDRFPS